MVKEGSWVYDLLLGLLAQIQLPSLIEIAAANNEIKPR